MKQTMQGLSQGPAGIPPLLAKRSSFKLEITHFPLICNKKSRFFGFAPPPWDKGPILDEVDPNKRVTKLKGLSGGNCDCKAPFHKMEKSEEGPCINITLYYWCLYRHLCILPERFGKKDLFWSL